jgi:hypothetical protein
VAYAKPKNRGALAGRLRRAQTFLRMLGIEISFTRESRAGTRTITIRAGIENRTTIVSAVSAVCKRLPLHLDRPLKASTRAGTCETLPTLLTLLTHSEVPKEGEGPEIDCTGLPGRMTVTLDRTKPGFRGLGSRHRRPATWLLLPGRSPGSGQPMPTSALSPPSRYVAAAGSRARRVDRSQPPKKRINADRLSHPSPQENPTDAIGAEHALVEE